MWPFWRKLQQWYTSLPISQSVGRVPKHSQATACYPLLVSSRTCVRSVLIMASSAMPSPALVATWNGDAAPGTFKGLLDWSRISGPLRAGLLAALDTDEAELIRSLAMLTEEAANTIVTTVRVNNNELGPYRSPNCVFSSPQIGTPVAEETLSQRKLSPLQQRQWPTLER